MTNIRSNIGYFHNYWITDSCFIKQGRSYVPFFLEVAFKEFLEFACEKSVYDFLLIKFLKMQKVINVFSGDIYCVNV